MKPSSAWYSLIAGLLLATASSAFAGWYNPAWAYRKAITIDHTKIPNTDQSSFPVLVSLTSDAGLSTHALSTGNDILFTASDGITKIPYERESYSSGTLVTWVNVTTLSHTADTVIYMYYGNASATDQQAATSVWDSNYKGVWHLKENPRGTAPQMGDSTAGANSGTTASGFVAGDQQTGKIGLGLHFAGAVNYDVSMANQTPFNFQYNNPFTIEYWTKPVTSSTGKETPLSKLQNSGVFPGYEIGHNVNGTAGNNTPGMLRMILVNSASGTKHQISVSTASATKLNDGNWHHYIYTYSGSGTAAGVKFYQDGVALATTSDEDDLASNSIQNSTPLHFGTRENAGLYYNGLLDEVRISAAVRSPDWISTEWTNQASPSTFYALSSEQTATPSTTTLGAVTTPQTYGTVTFSATVSPGAATGTMTFKDGATTLGAGTLSGGTASYTLTASQLTVAGSPHSITAVYSGDSSYSSSTSSVSPLTITAKALTVTGLSVPASKVYDGTTVTATPIGSPGVQTAEAAGPGTGADGKPYTGDTVSISGTLAGNYNFKDVATASLVTITGLSTANGNYTLTSPTQSATITAKSLTATGTLSAPASKVYDGTTSASVSGASALQATEAAGAGTTSDGKPYSVDSVSVTGTASYAYNTKDVGASAVIVSGLSLANNSAGDYTLIAPSLSAGITAKALTMSGLSAPASKVYDGTTAATVSGSPGTLTGSEAVGNGSSGDGKWYTGDAVSPAGTVTGTYNSKNVATATTVTYGGLSLAGAQAGDYTLTIQSPSSATITATALTVSAAGVNKTYDGTTAATVTLSDNHLGSDVVTESYASASFADSNLGTGKTVSVSGISISGGADAGNYSLGNITASTTANITAAPLTILANNQTKAYGATLTFGAGQTAFSAAGLAVGETVGTVTLTASGGTAATAAVGTYTITPSAVTGGTFTAANYTITYTTGTLTVVPGAIASYVVTATTPQQVGVAFNVTVTAMDSGSNTVTSDNSTVVTMTSSTGNAQFDSDGNGTFGDNTATLAAGTFTISVKDSVAENITLTATDATPKTGTSASIVINPGVPGQIDHYLVSAVSPQMIGRAFAVTVTAKDFLNNTVATNNSTQVTLANSGSLQFDGNGNGTFGEANDNKKTLSGGTFGIQAMDAVAETITITAADTNGKSGTLTGLAVNAVSNNFAFWRTVTINHTKVVGTQTNFPVLISVTDPALAAHALASGFDILFTASDGTTVLSYERESYNSATGTLLAWVKIPVLSSTTDTVLYLYYGNPTATDQQNATAAWDSNFKAVWHLDELGNGTAGEYKDSTTNANNAQGKGGIPTQVAGKIGVAQYCSAANQDYMQSANKIGISNNAVRTITFWTLVTTSNRMAWVGWGSNTNNGEFEAAIRPNPITSLGQGHLFLWGYGANDWDTGVSPLANSWHHHAIVYDGTKANWYLDGSAIVSTNYGTNGFTHTYATYDSQVLMGYEYDVPGQSSVAYLDGYIDEVRISKTNRSLSWIQTEYNNELNASTFSTLGSEQTSISTAVSSTANPSVYGQSVAFGARVTWGGGTPTGTLQFRTNGVNFGSPVTLVNGTATSAAITTLPAGNIAVTTTFTDGITTNLSTGTLAGGQTVGKAPLTVTANAASKTYGSANPAFSASYAGFQNGETSSVLSGSPSLTTTATTGSAVGSYTITAATGTLSAANYSFSFVNGTLTVNPVTLTITAANANKTYGLTLSFAGTEFSSSGLLNGDSITSVALTSAGSSAIAPAASYSIVPGSAVGAGLGNYTIAYVNGTLTVNRRPITVTAVSDSKSYDDTTSSSGTPTITGGPVNQDLPNFTQTFDTKNVGTGKTLTPAGTMLDGNGGNNYSVTFVNNTSGVITSGSLTVTGISATSKVYDQTTTASLNLGGATLNGVTGGDIVALNTGNATGAFADKTVGNGKTVTVTGLTLSGRDAANYTLAAVTTTANITPVSLTVTGITANSKVYDTTNTASLNLGGATLNGVISGDTVTLSTDGATGSFTNSTVGNGETVTVSGLTIGGADASNYVLATTTTTADITPASLTVTGITANDKVYDGTLPASLNVAGALLQGVLGADRLTLSIAGASGAFADATAGQGKTVYVSGLTVSGSDVGNYSLLQPTTTANITPAGLTVTGITANNKIYDGTAAATLNLGNATFQGVISGDIVILNYASATGAFADKTVGNGKTVTISGLALGGRDGGNYTMTQPTAAANITPLGISVVGVSANNKVYDQTTAATLSGTPTLAGAMSGDIVTLGGAPSAYFGDKTVANNKPVTVAGYTIGGADAGNYMLAQPAGLAANITPVSLAVTGITANNKAYDGTTTATLNVSGATLNGVISGDAVTLSTAGAIGAFADATAGQGKTVYVSGLTISGVDAGNYSLTQPTATATITTSLDHFLVTVSGPQTAGTPFNISITAQDFNNVTLSDFNGTVDLTTTAGTISPTNSGAFTAGVLTTQSVTVTGAGSGQTITATDHAGSGKTGTSAGFTVNAAAVSPANSTISPATPSIPADGLSTQVITVQARDLYNNNVTVGGEAVVFSKTGGGTLSGTTDNGNGTYTAILTSPLITGSATVTATLGLTQVGTSVGAASSVVTFRAGTAVAANSTLSPATATMPADGSNTLVITVQARDVRTNNLTMGGDTVVIFKQSGAGTVSSTTDNGDGTYTATFTSPTTTGTTTMGATVDGTAVGTTVGASSLVVTLVPGPVSAARSTVTADPTNNVPSDGNTFSTITVVVKDAFDNPIPGRTVSLSVIGHSYLITAPAPTDTNGLTTAQITSTLAETKTISASVGATNITQQARVAFVPAPVSPISSSVSVNPSGNLVADGTAFSTITVTLMDPNFNAVPGQTVTLSVSGTGNTVSTPPLTDANGQTTATLTSTNAGTKTVTASVGATTLAQHPTVTFGSASASAAHSSVTASPTNNVAADGSAFSTITVTVRDAQDNPVAGQTVGLSVVGHSYTLTTPAPTDANGRAIAQLSSTLAETKTVIASVAGSAIAQQAQITFVAGAVNPFSSTVSASPNNNIPADGTTAATITVSLMDANFNPVTGQTVTLSVSGTGNTVSTPAVTDANGRTTATLTSTASGTKTVTASVGTTTIVQQPTVTFAGGTVNALTSTVSVNPNTNVTANGSAAATITVIVKDGNSSGIPGQTVILSVSGAGNTVSTPPVTDASGQTTATLTSTNAETKTVTASVGTTTIAQQPTVTFVSGPATQLVFATQPGSATYGAPLSPQPVVKTKDAFGNDSAVGLGTSELVSLAESAGTGSLQGTTSLDIGTSAGNGIVSFSGLEVSSAGTGNQLTASAPNLASATSAAFGIGSAPLTVTANDQSRGYGATNEVFTAGYSGLVNGDGSGVLNGTLSFSCQDTNGVNVDTNTPVGTYLIVAGGQSAANYNLTYVNGTLTVTQAVLTVSADSLSKLYGAAVPELTVSYSGFVNGEDTNVLSGTPTLTTTADTNSTVAGSPYVISVTNGTLSATNYSFAFVDGQLSIATAAVSANVTVANKGYDGTTSATITGRSLNGVYGSDDVSLAGGTASFADKNAGTNKPVTVSGLSLSGGSAANYALVTNTLTVSADITPATLHVSATAQDKVYDGTAMATVTLSDDRLSGDAFTTGYSAATFSDKNAGTSKTVSVSGISLSGADAGNYSFNATASATANIAPLTITVSAADNSKTYDGTTSAAAIPTITTGALQGTDTAAFTELYDTKDMGNGKTLTPSGSVNDGNGGNNYTVSFATDNNGIIQPATLTVTADNKIRPYGVANPILTASYGGFVGGDTQSMLVGSPDLGTAATQTSAAGTYPITAGLGTLSALNYTFSFVDGTLTVLAAPQLTTVGASANGFVFSFSTVAGLQYQVEYKDNLGSGTWTPLGQPIAGTGSWMNVTNTISVPQRFFRLNVQ